MFRLPGKAGWRLWRERPNRLPGPGDAALMFLICFGAMLYVGPSFLRINGPSALTPAEVDLARLGILGQQIALLFLPVAVYSVLRGFDLKRTFRLRGIGLHNLLLSVLIGLSGFVLLAFLVQVEAGLFENMKKVLEDFERLMSPLISGNLAAPILIFAVAPAACEEALFRGLLLTGFTGGRREIGILITAALFGLMHLERALHTCLLGLVLAYVVLRTGSLLAGMTVHFVNNLAALLVFRLEKAWAIRPEDIGAPVLLLIVSAALVIFAGSVYLLSTGPGEATAHQ